jgi:hypothetical protein
MSTARHTDPGRRHRPVHHGGDRQDPGGGRRGHAVGRAAGGRRGARDAPHADPGGDAGERPPHRVALKGPLTTPVGTGFRSINVALRKEFDLYANVRPALTLMSGGRYEDIDLVLIRENTEGLYVGVEHYIGVGEDPRARPSRS